METDSNDMKKDPWFEFPARRDSRGRIQIPKDILENFQDRSEQITVRIAATVAVKATKEGAKV